MRKPENWSHIIVTDMPVGDDWTFATMLGKCLGTPFTVVSADGRANVSRWRRIGVYVAVAMRLFAHHKHIDVMVSWQQFFGLIYASLCSLFRVKKHTDLIVMGFIYRPKRAVVGRIYRWWVRQTLRSGYIDRVIVYSRHEVDYYATLLDADPGLFHFIALGIDNEDAPSTSDDGFWFTSGKSCRDYDFLIGSMANTAHRLVIVCDTLQQPEAANIQVVHKTFGKHMVEIMSRAHGVVIALDNQDISCGQLVMLQAMALGKPIVVTRSHAITDYVEHGINALIVDKDSQSLLSAIELLNNDSHLHGRMSAASRQRFAQCHTMPAFTRAVAALLGRQPT